MIRDDRPASRVLVELDAIFDTRLGTLRMIDERSASACYNDERYFTRIIDDFSEMCGVSREQFRDAYSRRNVETIENSIITEIPFVLAELTMKLGAETLDTPFVSEVVVHVNCYPYTLDAEEQEIIASAVAARCLEETKVECVFIPPEQLTPRYILEWYSGMILYNHREWMEKQLEEFKTARMPRVCVHAPAIYYDEVPSKDEFTRNGIAPHITGFQLSELATTELYALSLLPAINFSIVRIPGIHIPENPKK